MFPQNFPNEYSWLKNIGVLPRVLQEAIPLYGTAEVIGTGSSKTILSWRDTLNQNGVKISGYSDDGVPWCGLFAAYVAFKAGKAVVDDPLWALNWAKFGDPVARRGNDGKLSGVDGRKPSLGDVLAYKRPGGGHVNFYIGETATHFVGLGGNQGDQVNIKAIPKAQCVAVRRPLMTSPPASMKPIQLARSGEIAGNLA
ncbi:TIGR02594 family protein [Novosphingobium sp.]|uniref:TIGR02594 family protein n=1 Tax=Novosphingobium sp. TaxID=1874826 RepID=UPI002632C4DA|nr:TIGR02594 family protein [Novosphingobium sp.]